MNEKFRKKSRKNTENEMLFRRSKKEKIFFYDTFIPLRRPERLIERKNVS